MAKERVFLSYLREDGPRVEALKRDLRSRDVEIIDGKHTRLPMAEAMGMSTLCVACFSDRGHDREELKTAIDQLQTLEHDRSWLVAVRLTPCEVPATQITPRISLSELLVESKDVLTRIERAPARSTINSKTETKRIQAPRAIAGGLRATGRAIRGTDITTTTTIEDVTGDESAMVFGVILTDSQGDES